MNIANHIYIYIYIYIYNIYIYEKEEENFENQIDIIFCKSSSIIRMEMSLIPEMDLPYKEGRRDVECINQLNEIYLLFCIGE